MTGKTTAMAVQIANDRGRTFTATMIERAHALLAQSAYGNPTVRGHANRVSKLVEAVETALLLLGPICDADGLNDSHIKKAEAQLRKGHVALPLAIFELERVLANNPLEGGLGGHFS